MSVLWIFAASVGITVVLSSMRAADDRASTSIAPAPVAVPIPGLQNTFRVTDRIYSGSQPDSDAAFAGLARLGVRTILSVDGSKPDVERAHQYGLRYVHLPFGYDGVPTNRVAELAKIMTLAPGLVYVHCHHGMHRGPVAVAIMCESVAGWSLAQAVAWLHQAGTSEEYPGLYQAARAFKKPSEAKLSAATSFPEVARTSSLVDTMVSIDQHLSSLQQCQKAAWNHPAGHPDLSPNDEATLLWEQFRKLARGPEIADRPKDFHQKLGEAERRFDRLRNLLSSQSSERPTLDAALETAALTCTACHKVYRNPTR
jgi:hypothetical protein